MDNNNSGTIAPPPPPNPNAGAPPPAESKSGKVLKTLAILGCLGFLGCILSVCGGIGYLFYLEESVTYGEPTEDEIVKKKVKMEEPFDFDFTWNGVNYAGHDVWLVIEGKRDGDDFEVEGAVGCSRYGDPSPRTFKLALKDYGVARYKKTKKGKFTAWFKVYDEYSRARSTPYTCKGVAKATKGSVSKARVVVTRRQRPSDFLSF